MDKIKELILNNPVYLFLAGKYEEFGLQKYVPTQAGVIIACMIAVFLVVLLLVVIFKKKKRTIKFYVGEKKFVPVFAKKGSVIKYPEISLPEGYTFAGWYKDVEYVEAFEDIKFNGKKNLSLYAKFVTNELPAQEEYIEEIQEEAPILPVEENATFAETVENKDEVLVDVPTQEEAQEEAPAAEEVVEEAPAVEEVPLEEQPKKAETEVILEEKISKPKTIYTIGEIYDELRYQILGYERVKSLSKFGVERKQYIAEMFERDEKIYLFLAIDPDLMRMRGYSVTRAIEPEFAAVPCEMVVASGNDLQAAFELIDETMKFNFLVRSSFNAYDKVVSDEATRKNGFAFFIKNETIATTAADYYKLLRASTLAYAVADSHKDDGKFVNKIILKLFKNDEEIYLYLALDAEAEGLDFVGYDRSFADTPAMFQVKCAEDIAKANVLIDKLMYQNDMIRSPEKVEVNLDEAVENSCGFGYRVRY